MAEIMSWLDSYGLDSKVIVSGVIIVVTALIIVLCVKKLLSVAIGMAAFLIIVPMLSTVFFGDGESIVDKATEYLAPEVAEKVEQGYEYFKEQESEHPLLNHDKIQETVDDVINQLFEERWNLPAEEESPG